jgi:gamma-glutamyl-gamma-aminobutyrate hydrolase PuuD
VQASYVKFVESGGGIPIPINLMKLSDQDIMDLMDKLNGVLFTGGGTVLQEDEGLLTPFTQRVAFVYNYAKTLNDRGVYYPVWAVCMGF